MPSYEIVGQFQARTIVRHSDGVAKYESFQKAIAGVLADLSKEINDYNTGVQVKDRRYEQMKDLRNHLRTCTEDDCQILFNPNAQKPSDTPPPDKQ